MYVIEVRVTKVATCVRGINLLPRICKTVA